MPESRYFGNRVEATFYLGADELAYYMERWHNRSTTPQTPQPLPWKRYMDAAAVLIADAKALLREMMNVHGNWKQKSKILPTLATEFNARVTKRLEIMDASEKAGVRDTCLDAELARVMEERKDLRHLLDMLVESVQNQVVPDMDRRFSHATIAKWLRQHYRRFEGAITKLVEKTMTVVQDYASKDFNEEAMRALLTVAHGSIVGDVNMIFRNANCSDKFEHHYARLIVPGEFDGAFHGLEPVLEFTDLEYRFLGHVNTEATNRYFMERNLDNHAHGAYRILIWKRDRTNPLFCYTDAVTNRWQPGEALNLEQAMATINEEAVTWYKQWLAAPDVNEFLGYHLTRFGMMDVDRRYGLLKQQFGDSIPGKQEILRNRLDILKDCWKDTDHESPYTEEIRWLESMLATPATGEVQKPVEVE